MVALPFPWVVAISVTATLVQSLRAGAKRRRPAQVAFSPAALLLSSSAGFAHSVATAVLLNLQRSSSSLPGGVYFPSNSKPTGSFHESKIPLNPW